MHKRSAQESHLSVQKYDATPMHHALASHESHPYAAEDRFFGHASLMSPDVSPSSDHDRASILGVSSLSSTTTAPSSNSSSGVFTRTSITRIMV